MKNIKFVISSHNKNILNPRTTSFGCNCWKKESCPLNGECLTSQLVYRAAATNQLRHEEIHWEILPSKKDIATTREISNIKNTAIAQN